jgi:ABC-type branched-subunit amino acid transport system substrate-binding protein
MVSRRKYLTALAGGVVGVAVAGIGAFYFMQPRTALARSGEAVRIGHVASMTGFYADWGTYQDRGARLAVEEINAAGGINGRPIEYFVEDDALAGRPDITTAVRKAEKLVLENRIDFLLSSEHSGISLALQDLCWRYKIPQFVSISCTEYLPTANFKETSIFQNPDMYIQTVGFPKFMVENFGKKCFIFSVDYAMGRADARQWYWGVLREGGQVLGISFAPLGTPDFTPWFPKIKAANPDFLVLAFAGLDVVRCIKQLWDYGLTPNILPKAGPDCSLLEPELALAEKEYESHHTNQYFYSTMDIPSAQRFVKAFKERWGEIPGNAAAYAYDNVYLIKELVEKAGGTPREVGWDKFHSVIDSFGEFRGVEGRKWLRPEDHRLFADMTLLRVEKGRLKPISVVKMDELIKAVPVRVGEKPDDPPKEIGW